MLVNVGVLVGGAIFALLIAIGAVSDLRSRRIPNWVSLALLVTGLGFTAYASGWSVTGNHALHALAALVVGMAIYAIKFWGGGDAKFYTGIAAWFALGEAIRLLVLVALCGALLAVVWWLVAKIRGSGDAQGAMTLPYGVAIAGGAAAAMFAPLPAIG